MMIKKGTLGLLAALTWSAPPQESIDPQQWLQEAELIISPTERRQFKTLEDEAELRDFIREFWRKRDPDPATEANEARQEHYRRLEYVEKHFQHAGRTGWRTSRGRIYVIHGEPDNRIVFPSRTERVGAQGEGAVEVSVELPESELWTYYNLQTLKGPKGLTEFFFLRGGSINLALFPDAIFTTLEPRQTLVPIPGGAARDYELTYVGRPLFNDPASFLQLLHNSLQVGYNPFDTAQLTTALAEVERPSGDLVQERFRYRDRLREEISSSVFFDEIQVEARYWFLASADGYSYIPLAVHLPGKQLEGTKELALMVDLRREGRSVASLSDTLRLADVPPARLAYEGIHYQTRLAVRPGEHLLEVFLLDRSKKRLGHLQEAIQVPDLRREGLAVSDLILCRQVQEVKAARREGIDHDREWLTYSPTNPLRVDDFVLTPSVEGVFRRKDTLTAFLEIYRPRLQGGKPDLEVTVRILQQGRPVGLAQAARLDYLTRDELDKVSYAIGLSLDSLQPDRYTVEAQIRDRLSGTFQSVSAPFELL